jgi:hypothetical protein
MASVQGVGARSSVGFGDVVVNVGVFSTLYNWQVRARKKMVK